jgi:signal transduction histidine kinase
VVRTIRALAIEDNPVDLAILMKVASRVEGDVRIAIEHRPGPAGVAEALRAGVDVVFLDYMLGDRDGLELLREVRAGGDETPVIFLTGAEDVHVASQAIRAGAFDYLLKSELTPDTLRRAVVHALRAREAEEEKRALERRVRYLERMDAVALFASGIAHDFNNLLTGILGWGSIALEDARPGADVEAIRKMVEAARKMGDLVAHLREAARRTERRLAAVPLGALAREVAGGLRAGAPAGITIDVACPPEGDVVVAGDRERLETAIRNLAVNGIEAMRGRGRLAIRVRRERPGPGDAAEPEAVVEVEDEGVGIAPEIADRIFDAYFTTKDEPTTKGLGLGLTLVHGIARSHGGRVEFTSRPCRTVFQLRLPCASSPAREGGGPDRGPAPGAAAPPRGGARA